MDARTAPGRTRGARILPDRFAPPGALHSACGYAFAHVPPPFNKRVADRDAASAGVPRGRDDAQQGAGVTPLREALVFGGSGQIGAALLPRLQASGWRVHAVSRRAPPSSMPAVAPGSAGAVRWLRGDLLHVDGLPAGVDAIFSCGPLDHFARWYAAGAIAAPCVVAFGSTSVSVKQASGDAGERALATRLADAEALLWASAVAHGASATVLRPTLVYGAGRDATLSRIAALARRTGVFVLPGDATGRRQPVHVDDLAAAAVATASAPAQLVGGRGYDLPGGEAVAYRDMVERVLAALAPPATLWTLPSPLFALAVRLARAGGRLQGFGPQALARLREDLVFDAGAAASDFGYAPRAFAPTAEMLLRPPPPSPPAEPGATR